MNRTRLRRPYWLFLIGALATMSFLATRYFLASRHDVAVATEEGVGSNYFEQSGVRPSQKRHASSDNIGGGNLQPEGELAHKPQIRLVYHARHSDEWQGMPVELTQRQASCRQASDCGLAMACLGADGCGPCTTDAQCDPAERCVLDHCILSDNVECRRRKDCSSLGEEAFCILSGYSTDVRGNRSMRAFCQQSTGGIEQTSQHELTQHGGIIEIPSTHPQKLLDSIQ